MEVNTWKNKKVLLRERKRHTARRVAIAISCYSGGGGVPWQNFFFPVWTCIKPNLVSKIFPFTETGYPPPKNLRPGTPPENLRPGTLPQKSETWDPPKIWDLEPPPKIWDLGPPQKTETWDPLPKKNLRPGTPQTSKSYHIINNCKIIFHISFLNVQYVRRTMFLKSM